MLGACSREQIPGRIAYTDSGGAHSPTLLFIHGWAGDQGHWQAQVDRLSDRYRVVTIDLPGHGRSRSELREWRLRYLAADVEALVLGLDLYRVILVGHSMGAAVALEAAPRLPDRVIGVVGVDSLHDAEHPPLAETAELLLKDYERDFAGMVDRFVDAMFPPAADAALVERVAKRAAAARPEVAVPLLRDMLAYDVPAALQHAGVPVRCINARRTAIETNRTYLSDFDAVTIPSVGHYPMLEKPDEFNAVLARLVDELAD